MPTYEQPQAARAGRRNMLAASTLARAPASRATAAARPALRHLDPQLRSDPVAAVLARSVAQRSAARGPVLQRWWAGTRQLSGMGFLGVPWDFGGNPWNLGLYHKHLFLEDGQDPADVGHMGPTGLGQDTDHSKKEYKKTQEGDNDATMRLAIAKHDPAPPYELTDSNCQRWVSTVIATYQRLGGKLGRQPAMEMSNI